MGTDSGQLGARAQHLAIEPLAGLSAELGQWRSDYEQQQMQRTKGEGRVFDFVKGLRLSARLIYIIRDRLWGASLEADWGQIMDDTGALLSPECDVIIHEPGFLHRWNGRRNHVMDFRFIKRSKVVAVISCKSLVRSIRKEFRGYCSRMKAYVPPQGLWLFAECVPVGKEKKLKRDAKGAGYAHFWYLHSWDGNESQLCADEEAWLDFLTVIEGLG